MTHPLTSDEQSVLSRAHRDKLIHPDVRITVSLIEVLRQHFDKIDRQREAVQRSLDRD